MEARWKQVVSRGALLFLGLVVLWGGAQCLVAAQQIDEEFDRRQQRQTSLRDDTSGAEVLMLIGGTLVVAGGGLAILSLLPLSVMERIRHPRAALHENPEAHPQNMRWS